MITIPYENINGGVILERELTDNEYKTVTSCKTNGTHKIFYQGDEPIVSQSILLSQAIHSKNTEIDNNTSYLIQIKGYLFKTFTFACSITDQLNLTGLLNEIDNGMVINNIPIKRYNGEGETGDNYYLLNSQDIQELRTVIFTHINGYRVSGINLKNQVNNLIDINDVINFVDPRI